MRLLVASLLALASAKRVAVTEMVIDSPLTAIEFLGKGETLEVIALSVSGNLYIHNTKSNKWDLLNEELETRFGGKKANTMGKSLKFRSFQKHPKDPNVWLLRTRDGRFFVHDGKTMLQAKVHGQANGQQEVVFHPEKPMWALMSMWRGKCNDERTLPGETGPCRKELYATPNLFQSEPKLIAAYVAAFAWGPTNGPDTVLYSQYVNMLGDQPSVFKWETALNLMKCSIADKFEEKTLLLSRGNRFLVSNGYIFVAQAKSKDDESASADSVTLMVSTTGGKVFNRAEIPSDLSQQGYAIIDTSENAVMLFVNHAQAVGSRPTGNVYISDSDGYRFNLALENVVAASGGNAEFDLVQSLEGVYIANVVYKPDDAKDADEDEQDATTASAIDRRHSQARKGKSESRVRTVVSFDKGGYWSYLQPPRVDSRGKPYPCAEQPDCKLHLHGNPDFKLFPPYYSVPTATGLVIGVGNVGPDLRSEGDEVNTYLSRDGGLTWMETMPGSYIYEFGDHGGLIVMASTAAATKVLKFSWNEGGSWYEIDLSSTAVDVDNIVTSPNFTSTRFVLYGTRGSAGVIIDLDFATLEQGSCTGVWGAGSSSSDYEVWSPSDGRLGAKKCLLGRELVYTRRRPTSECFNGEQYERKEIRTPCECVEEDFSCDFGFRRKIGSVACEHMGQFVDGTTCGTDGFVVVDSHRKVPGNGCTGGWEPRKATVPCNSTTHKGRNVIIVMFVLLVAMGAMALATSSDRVKALLTNVGFESYKDVRYATVGAGQPGGFAELDEGFDDRFLDDGDASEPEVYGGSFGQAQELREDVGDFGAGTPDPDFAATDFAAVKVPALSAPPEAPGGGGEDLL